MDVVTNLVQFIIISEVEVVANPMPFLITEDVVALEVDVVANFAPFIIMLEV